MGVLQVDLEGRCMTKKIQGYVDEILEGFEDFSMREDYMVRINAKNTDTRLNLPIHLTETDKKKLCQELSKKLKCNVTMQTKTLFVDYV